MKCEMISAKRFKLLTTLTSDIAIVLFNIVRDSGPGRVAVLAIDDINLLA